MKHLKTFESMSDLTSRSLFRKQFLEDMSLELCDNNFDVVVSSEILKRDDGFIINDAIIVVRIMKKNKPSPLGAYGAPRFDYNDVKDTLLSMVSYMESEDYTIGSIEVSSKYVHNLIPVQLKEEELYLKFKPEEKMNYLIGQLIIKFKE
jgi:hypothetical protein